MFASFFNMFTRVRKVIVTRESTRSDNKGSETQAAVRPLKPPGQNRKFSKRRIFKNILSMSE